MSPRRRVRATELAGKNKSPYLLRHFFLLLVVGGIFLFFMNKWTGGEDYDRFKGAKKYSEYYKEFFVELPVTYKVFDDVKLVVRATNLGSEFWNKEFYSMVKKSENEVNEMMKIEEWINTPDANNSYVKQKVNLSSFPDIYQLIKEGKELSEKSLYNIASGEIFDFWEIALKNYNIKKKALDVAKSHLNYLYDSPFLAPAEIERRKKVLESLTKEKTKVIDSVESVIARIKAFGNDDINRQLDKAMASPSSLLKTDKQALLISILQAMEVYSKSNISPKPESVETFYQYVLLKNIVLNEQEKSVSINSVNTGMKLSFFKEALFLKKLKEKIPKDNFNYLIYLGDRHGMWKLPSKFIRWTVTIDNPYEITNKGRGAIKLLPEEGYFVVTRKNEEIIIDEMPDITKKIRNDFQLMGNDSVKKNEYVLNLIKEYPSKSYIFDPATMTMSKKYDLPVDWRIGKSSDKNMSAMVIGNDPVKARMYSYSLFISEKNEMKSFADSNPDIIFAVLSMDESIFVPDKWKDLYLTREQVKKIKIEFDNKTRGLNPDGSIPEKK